MSTSTLLKELGELRLDIQNPENVSLLSRRLFGYLMNPWKNGARIIILCIGTDRSTGDALGPLVGSQLAYVNMDSRVVVCGTLESPLHAGNLGSTLDEIKAMESHKCVIAIDACLGRSEHVGSICIGLGPLRPGAGVHKNLPHVGDVFITGTVNVSGFMEYLVLQNTRLNLVMKMADVISKSTKLAISRLIHMASSCDALESATFRASALP